MADNEPVVGGVDLGALRKNATESKVIGARFPAEVVARIKAIADAYSLSSGKLVRMIVDSWLKQYTEAEAKKEQASRDRQQKRRRGKKS